MSKLYRIIVTKEFSVEEIVEADDYDHALEIGSEIADFEMECDSSTFIGAEWDAEEVSGDYTVTYEPVQEYLK